MQLQPLRHYLAIWAVLTLLALGFVFARSRLSLAPLPDRAAQSWAYAWLDAAASGRPLPAPPDSARSYRAAGPILISAYRRGRLQARQVGSAELIPSLERAAQQLRAAGLLAPAQVFRIVVTRAEGPLWASIPGLALFSLVPLRDGLVARLRGAGAGARPAAYLTPDDLVERGAYDKAVRPPIPDLSFGTALPPLFDELARELGVEPAELFTRAELKRVAFSPLLAAEPNESLAPEVVLSAAREHARFILRHQAETGRYAYIYDAYRDRAAPPAHYNLARHSGTTFFLAQAARTLELREARLGALRALDWLRSQALTQCGSPERSCAIWGGDVEVGASALAALAAAEFLRGGDEPRVRELLRGLLAFLRAQQRPDGELMHEYDLEAEQPIDIQHMYYSGEAALALLAGYETLGDPRDKAAAKRLMTHLTGAGWRFFGARYFYGEEHWTCQAVGRAAAHMDVASALEFCLRWGEYQRRLQYLPGQTPWPVSGALGVGPVLLPRVTLASSRIEALVPIYRLQLARGVRDDALRRQLERGVELLLRMRWDGRERHLFARPDAALGGMPNTPAELSSRADMVQHAGSALLAWAELHTRPD